MRNQGGIPATTTAGHTQHSLRRTPTVPTIESGSLPHFRQGRAALAVFSGQTAAWAGKATTQANQFPNAVNTGHTVKYNVLDVLFALLPAT